MDIKITRYPGFIASNVIPPAFSEVDEVCTSGSEYSPKASSKKRYHGREPVEGFINRRILLVTLVTLVVLILTFLAVSYFFIKSKRTVKDTLKQESFSQQKKLTSRDYLERSLKLNFTSSKDKDILTYFDLASGQKDVNQKYQYLLKSYKQAVAAGQSADNPKYDSVINQFKQYLEAYPQYKKSDTENLK